MRKIEKIREMVRGRKVTPTFFNSNYERRNYNLKKQAINYLKEKGYAVNRCESVIEDIENFLQNTSVVIKTDINAIKELLSLPARKTDEMYQHFLRKCELIEMSMNAYLDRRLSTLFNLIKDHTVDYRDIKDTEMSYLFTKDAPNILETEIKGYGKLSLKWEGLCSGENFLLTTYEPTKKDYEAMEKVIFFPPKDIAAGTEREHHNCYIALNTNYPKFIISESDIEKIMFDGVKKLSPEKEYYYWDYWKKERKQKVLKLVVEV